MVRRWLCSSFMLFVLHETTPSQPTLMDFTESVFSAICASSQYFLEASKTRLSTENRSPSFVEFSGAHYYTCSFEICCDRGVDGVPSHDALPVNIVGVQWRHVAVKPDQQLTQCYPPSVSQTPTGPVTTAHNIRIHGITAMVQNASKSLSQSCCFFHFSLKY